MGGRDAIYGSDFPLSLWGAQAPRGQLSAIGSPVPECPGKRSAGIRHTDAGFCCLAVAADDIPAWRIFLPLMCVLPFACCLLCAPWQMINLIQEFCGFSLSKIIAYKSPFANKLSLPIPQTYWFESYL